MGKKESAAGEGVRWKFQSSKPSTPSKRAAAKAGYRRDNLHHEPLAPDPPPAALRQAGGSRAHAGCHLPGDGQARTGTDLARQSDGLRPLRLPAADLGTHPPSLLESGGPPLVH